MRVFVLILGLLLSGCVFGKKNRTASDNLNPAGPWGYYSGNIDTRWDADGRTMTLALSSLLPYGFTSRIWTGNFRRS